MDDVTAIIQQHNNTVNGIIGARLHDINMRNINNNNNVEQRDSGYPSNSNSIALASRYEKTDVLGVAGELGKSENSGFAQSTSSNSIITYINNEAGKCWGSNGLHNKKTLTLASTGSTDIDMEQLGCTLRAFNFNLDVMLLQNNKIGDNGVASWIKGLTSQSFQTLYDPIIWYVSPDLKVTQSVVCSCRINGMRPFGPGCASNLRHDCPRVRLS